MTNLVIAALALAVSASLCRGDELEVRRMTNAPAFDFRGVYEGGASFWLLKAGCQMVQITSRITNAVVYALQFKPADTNNCCWMTFGEIVVGPVTNDQDVVVPRWENIYRLRRIFTMSSNAVLYSDRGLYVTNYPTYVDPRVVTHFPPVPIKPPSTGVGTP